MFLRVHPELLGPIAKPTLLERFERSLACWNDINQDGWKDWFDPDIPSDLAWPEGTEFIEDVVSDMLESGVALWSHPGWYSSLWDTLGKWYDDEKLIRIRLSSDWLLQNAPEDPLDVDFVAKLQHLSNGFFHILEGVAFYQPEFRQESGLYDLL